jgi:Zn-dependent peptidase ImmA (M78 family)
MDLELLTKFVQHCIAELGLHNEGTIKLSLNATGIQSNEVSAGGFNPNTLEITVCVKNRAVADVFRTIAHELTHAKQFLVDKVDFPEDDEGLQKFEDEANVMAGRLVRFFGRENRGIYSDLVQD